MNKMALALAVAVLASLGGIALAGKEYVPGEKPGGNFEEYASVFLEKHCFDCHDDETSEAGLNLLELGKVDETNAEVWKSVWAQVSLEEMPPKKKAQPSIVDRLRFSDWIISELNREMKD